MALAFSHFELSVQYVDSGGDSTIRTYALNSADAAEAATHAAAVLAAVSAVSACTIPGYRLAQVFSDAAFQLPIGGVERENEALFVFQLEDPLKKATVSIPGARDTIFVSTSGPNRNVVNTTNQAVIDFRSLYQGAGPVTLSDGEKAEILLEGRRRHIRTRRG